MHLLPLANSTTPQDLPEVKTGAAVALATIVEAEVEAVVVVEIVDRDATVDHAPVHVLEIAIDGVVEEMTAMTGMAAIMEEMEKIEIMIDEVEEIEDLSQYLSMIGNRERRVVGPPTST